jgi:hypothetical protein
LATQSLIPAGQPASAQEELEMNMALLFCEALGVEAFYAPYYRPRMRKLIYAALLAKEQNRGLSSRAFHG